MTKDIEEKAQPSNAFWPWLLYFAIFLSQASWPTPEPNEPHYLAKAKHYWDADWITGDPFLDSKDAHLVFYVACGWWTRFLSLPDTAWLGRVCTCGLLAWGWLRLSQSLRLSALSAAAGAIAWIFLNERCQMAGEWVVGGFEAKGIAYALVLQGLAEIAQAQWRRAWLWLGCASAFHVLVGGWSVLAAAIAWLATGRQEESAAKQIPALLLGGLLSAPGVVPILWLNQGIDKEAAALAARIYFRRLRHHLDITSFRQEMIVSFVMLALVWFALMIWIRYARPASWTQQRRIHAFVLGTLLFAGVGLAITWSVWDQPSQRSSLLRYYFYRNADAFLPLGAALCLAELLCSKRASRPRWDWRLLLIAAIAAAHGAITKERVFAAIPRADKPGKIANYRDWVSVCEWIRVQTPKNAKFLTPRLGQTFKWRAERAEVVTAKDVPQDPRGLIAWHRLQQEVFRNMDPCAEAGWYQLPSEHNPESLMLLAKHTHITHVLTEKRYPLPWPEIYSNDTYVVYRRP